MDFEKAYDRVNRETMLAVLKTMGFGEQFRGMVETLYAGVEAKIQVNGELTEPLAMKGGVKQGCPLSPYLFICVLELMAVAVRQDQQIAGIKEPESGATDKLSLFADDTKPIFVYSRA